MLKRVLNAKPPGNRRKGRPKLRCEASVDADAKNLGVANLKIAAQDRDVWKENSRQLRPTQDCGASDYGYDDDDKWKTTLLSFKRLSLPYKVILN